MALARVTTWSSGQVLTAAALNAEFDSILNNALSLISPLTGNLNVNNNQLTSLLLERRATVATAGNEARIYYRTDIDVPQVDDGAAIKNLVTLPIGGTKGDIVVRTGTDAFSVIAASTNNYVLVGDSSTASGLRWAAATEVTGFNGPAIFYALPLWLPTP